MSFGSWKLVDCEYIGSLFRLFNSDELVTSNSSVEELKGVTDPWHPFVEALRWTTSWSCSLPFTIYFQKIPITVNFTSNINNYEIHERKFQNQVSNSYKLIMVAESDQPWENGMDAQHREAIKVKTETNSC